MAEFSDGDRIRERKRKRERDREERDLKRERKRKGKRETRAQQENKKISVTKNISIIQKRMSVCLSVRPSLKISVTTETIGFYSSGNIPTNLFLKIPLNFFFLKNSKIVVAPQI